MARPRLGDSESRRLQMVITADEVAAIDKWQHENHVASRSEAIRQIVAETTGMAKAADGPRKNRIPIMLSDEELQRIDDWRFKNRVGTRSGAIRRMIAATLDASDTEGCGQ